MADRLKCIEPETKTGRNKMDLVTRTTSGAKATGNSGPTIFEITYLDQLQKELATFLKSKNLSTLEAIVVGVKGKDYQLLIPIKGGVA